MRTLVRFLAFLAVFVSGLLLVNIGFKPPAWFNAAILASQPVQTVLKSGGFAALEGSRPELTLEALIAQGDAARSTPPPKQVVKVNPERATEVFAGELSISVIRNSERYPPGVDVTIRSPGWVSKRIEGMRMGEVAFYEGKRSVEVRLVDDLPLSGPYEAEFLVTERPRSTAARYSPTTGPTILEQARAELIRSGAATSTRLALLMGFVLIVSATFLVAVRPKVRPAPPRAIAAAAKPTIAQPPSAPVTLDLGPQEAPQSVSATFQTGTGRDGSLWRKVTGLHWRLIQPGWTEQQVRRLLGGPIKVRPAKAPTGEAVSVWHYYRGVFRVSSSKGTVTFKDGKVVGFAAPPMDYARWVAHTPNPEA